MLDNLFKHVKKWFSPLPVQKVPEVRRQEQNEKYIQINELAIETLEFYDLNSCQCAYPRFKQYVSMDSSDFDGSFWVVETEALIDASRPYFHIAEIDRGQECTRSIYTCKKCKSTFEFGWSDFSIHVNRSYLKPINVNAMQIGADALQPLPVLLGGIGHTTPPKGTFVQVGLKELSAYLKETIN